MRSRAGSRSCATLNAHPSPKPNANPNPNPNPDPNPKQELRDLAGTLQCNYEAQSRKQADEWKGLGIGIGLTTSLRRARARVRPNHQPAQG